MNILITGGTGFIGSRLAMKYRDIGKRVRVFGQQNTEAEVRSCRELERHGVEIVIGSVTNEREIAEAVKDMDVVFHLAAAQHEANVPDQHFRDVNVTGTRNVITACINAGVKRVVHGSTIGVFGWVETAVNENTPCRPDNIYGVTKLEGEKLALSFADRIPLVVIRISETYGPGDQRLLKLFRAISKKRFLLIGPGENLHPLIYISDLIQGLMQAAESEKAVGQIIALVGERSVSTEELCNTIAEELGVRIPKIRLPLWPFRWLAAFLEFVFKPLGVQPPLHKRRMEFFTKSFTFSTTKAKDALGVSPQIVFKTGVAKTVSWYIGQRLLKGTPSISHERLSSEAKVDGSLSAQIEPFDTFWEAPADIDKGFTKFATFYRRNYFKYLPADNSAKTLVISCGAGYFVEILQRNGYNNVLGIDSDPDKVAAAKRRGLNCVVANAFEFLRMNDNSFNLMVAEQEINHLTKEEILVFLELCHKNLAKDGVLFVHSLNGANPITGSEALAQNFNHFNTFTEYSLRQVLTHSNFDRIRIFPLNLYVFYENPLNYVGMVATTFINCIFRLCFVFYGKDNKIFSKKIAAACRKP